MTKHPGWTVGELDHIGAIEELEIAPLTAEGQALRAVPIWVVRSGDDLFIRSWLGARGSGFRAALATHAARISAPEVAIDVSLIETGDEVNDSVDSEYRAKYGGDGSDPSYVEAMVAPEARATTLKLLPSGRL